MSNIAALQKRMIDLLSNKMAASSSTDKPRQVKGYEGELADLKAVRVLPSVMVDVAQNFDLEADDVAGTIFSATYQPEVIIFSKNLASGNDTVSGLARLADWVIDALKSEIIMLDGPLELSRRIRGRMITDMEPASCILTFELTSKE
jgi:hypothetical protein